jgi:hypothetical protein
MKSNELNIGAKVTVDGKYFCEIIDIVEEDSIVYYEVSPLEFESFSRFVTIDKLS